MTGGNERRKESRKILSRPGVAVLHRDNDSCPTRRRPKTSLYFFVDLYNISPRGAMIGSSVRLAKETLIDLALFDPGLEEWVNHETRVAWVKNNPENDLFTIGLGFCGEPSGIDAPDAFTCDRPTHEDLHFLLETDLLKSLPRQDLCRFLNCLGKRPLEPGERLVTQGEAGDVMYLVQTGSLAVIIEKDGQEYRVARIGEGDVVGEMAFLTGEFRTAHVDAEKPAVVWGLPRSECDKIMAERAELRCFLTEIIARRFENSSHVADRLVGKYVIQGKIGKGGWSIVYNGVHQALKRPVAIKMMRHDMAMDPLFISTFRKEAEIIAGLRHENIVQVYDIDELYRTVFITMEYLEGSPLDAILKRQGALPQEKVCAYLDQILSGLQHAHDRGIVHRDIKPANIFVLPNDRIKILDFGLACSPGLEDFSIPGTIHYAPPEQIEGAPVDGRADLYALGVMAYEMLLGRRPYPEDDLARLMELHCGQDVPDPGQDRPDVPEALRRFILTCCRRDPNERFADCGQARQALAGLLKQDGGASAGRSRPMTALFLFHDDARRQETLELLEAFSKRAREIGATLRVVDVRDGAEGS